MYQQNFPPQSGNKPFKIIPENTDNLKKEPLKCWCCGEDHWLRDCPHRQQNSKRLYNIQEATIINDVARSMPWIYAALDNIQAHQQASILEM